MSHRYNPHTTPLYPPRGQKAILAEEFGISVHTLSKYLKREYPWYSQAYPRQQEICQIVYKRLGKLCLPSAPSVP